MTKPNPKPNVISREAAALTRSFVFERRHSDKIDHLEIVAHLASAGHGSDLPSTVRRKRMKSWVLQALRRLRKYGWLDAPGQGAWPPTAALRACPDAASLQKRAPRRTEPEKPVASSAPPEPWEVFAQKWVFQHRQSDFSLTEIAAAAVQRGYGTGKLIDRLEEAGEFIEPELWSLRHDGLLQYDSRSDLWQPTDLLREWPETDEG